MKRWCIIVKGFTSTQLNEGVNLHLILNAGLENLSTSSGVSNSKNLAENKRSRRRSNAYTACYSTGRLMEQFGNGLASRMPGMGRLATGRSYGSALIPLVGNNSWFINYSNANAYIYTNHMAVGFHLLLSLFGFLLFIYLFIYII